MDALLGSLTEDELALLRATERARMAELDEDGLVALHKRIRRARNKFTKLYRREASAKVAKKGGRGAARPKNTRNAGKAEIFEDALARVSQTLARAARQSAATLKAERLAAARNGSPVVEPVAPSDPIIASGRVPAARKAPVRQKHEASTLAAGVRREAKRGSR